MFFSSSFFFSVKGHFSDQALSCANPRHPRRRKSVLGRLATMERSLIVDNLIPLWSFILFLSFLLAPTVDGNNSPQNVPIPVTRNTNQIPVLTANAVTASIPVVTNHIPNGGVHVPHVRPRLPGGFPVRDSTISITPSDGIYGGGGLQSTQKGKYGNRDMKAELKDLEVDMDRITLGDLLEEGEEYLSIRLSEGSILLEQREKHHQKMSFC